jgi:hypothetical protein
MHDPHLLTAVIAVVYASLAAVDGLWLHLWRYRLHRHARREHAIHTLRAMLFPGVVVLLLMGWTTGPLLWCGTLMALVDLAVVAWDAAVETRTRDFQHGLPAGEAALHTLLQALHATVLVAAMAARPWSAWTLSATAEPGPGMPATVLFIGVLVGSVMVAVVHAVLLRSPHPRVQGPLLDDTTTLVPVGGSGTRSGRPARSILWRRRLTARRRLHGRW